MFSFVLTELVICGAFLGLLINAWLWRRVPHPPQHLSPRTRTLLTLLPFLVLALVFVGAVLVLFLDVRLSAWFLLPMFFGVLAACIAATILFSLLQALRGSHIYRRHWLHVTLNNLLLLVMQTPVMLFYMVSHP